MSLYVIPSFRLTCSRCLHIVAGETWRKRAISPCRAAQTLEEALAWGGGEGRSVAYNFIPCDREHLLSQAVPGAFLMPPSGTAQISKPTA